MSSSPPPEWPQSNESRESGGAFSPVCQTPAHAARSVFLTGPTGVGKSALAVQLALQFAPAEIISMDSMAIYRGMDIGTAKPPPEQRSQVPHHLIDIIEPHEEYSLAQYLADATQAAREIHARGSLAIFVGGTPLYLKSLLCGATGGPAPDAELRRRLRAEAEQAGTHALHDRLGHVDPDAARRIHPHDLRRIIRALEVFEKTGAPISATQTQFNRPADPAVRLVSVTLPREQIYRRINDRVVAMFRNGLVDEVRSLLVRQPPLSHTARQALGYKEVIDYLAGEQAGRKGDGAAGLDETIELVQRRSRQFAKRQLTWFRSLPGCRWVDASSLAHNDAISSLIVGDDAINPSGSPTL